MAEAVTKQWHADHAAPGGSGSGRKWSFDGQDEGEDVI